VPGVPRGRSSGGRSAWGRSSGGRSLRHREPSRGHGSPNAGPWQGHGATSRQQPGRGGSRARTTAAPLPRAPRGRKAALALPSPCSPLGGLPAHGTRNPHSRRRDPPFTESWDFSQGSPALALLELAAAMASPPAGSRERGDTSAPLPPRRGSRGHTGTPAQPLWARTQPGRHHK